MPPSEIEYKVTYVEGGYDLIRVESAFTNIGTEVALYRARRATDGGVPREIASVEPSRVVSLAETQPILVGATA